MVESIGSEIFIPKEIVDKLLEWNKWIKEEFPEAWESFGQPIALNTFSYIYKIKNLLCNNSKLKQLIELINKGPDNTKCDVVPLLQIAESLGIKDQVEKFIRKQSLFRRVLAWNFESEKREVLNIINNKVMSEANKAIIISTLQSSILILAEFYSVYQVWNTTQNADYIIKESEVEFKTIHSKFDELKQKVDALPNKMLNILDIDEKLRSKAFSIMRTQINEIAKKIQNLKQIIEKIKINLKTGIETIGKCENEQTIRLFTNMTQGITNAVQFGTYGGDASPICNAIQLGVTVSFFILTGLNIKNKICCVETIKKLRLALDQATYYENCVKELEETLIEIERSASEYIINEIPDDLRRILEN